jgi:STE24 endopeptidase
MTAETFTWIFAAALAATTVARLWLARRQIRFVRARRDRVPHSFEASIPLVAHQKAADYTIAKTELQRIEILTGAVVLALLTFGGVIGWLHGALAALAAPDSIGHGMLLIVIVTMFMSAAELPVSLYRTFSVEARFGFNKMTWRLYLSDLVKQTLVGAAIGLPLLALVLWLMTWIGPAWWLYVWLVWMGFNFALLLVYPSFIAPMFNRFAPLEDESLRQQIDALMQRCGFRAAGLFVMDGSRRSNHGNAYFTGFGAGKRIVLFDTLLARLDSHEILAVLAHELGHFRRRHVWKRVGLLACVSLGLLWVLGQLIDAPWFYAGLNVEAGSAGLALLLLFLVAPVFLFPLGPLASLYSRRHEYEADAYASAHASPASLAGALVKLYKDNASTLTPDPLHSAFYDSHPPAAMRIARLGVRA